MNDATRIKTVLIVDDEKSFLLSLVEGLAAYADDFVALTASNGQEAVALLGARPVDLVVTDIRMPVLDGFALLAHLASHYAGLPVVVMTAYATPEIRKRLDELGALAVLEKPVDFDELVRAVYAGLSAASRGFLQGITLAAFCQLVELERKTCTLLVESHGRKGRMYFAEGVLLDAEFGSVQHEPAAYEMVCWEDTLIEIESACRRKERCIQAGLGQVLMESFQRKDEGARDGSGAGLDLSDLEPAKMDPAAPEPTMPVPARPEHVNTITRTAPLGRKEVAMPTTKEILEEFAKLQGIEAVCLVGRDGFRLDSISRNGLDTDMVGAIAASGFGASASMGNQLAQVPQNRGSDLAFSMG